MDVGYDRARRAAVWAAALSVVVISLAGYIFVLENFFTGTDTLTLIETSRIQSLDDATRILTKPLMSGSRFVEVAEFYRPISSLSYSLDTSLWHLEPFGFQLTNLLLHVLASILVLLLLRALSNRDTLLGWLTAVLFAAHPILIETVPSIDRRHDVLATLFFLVSLLLFLKSKPGARYPRLTLGFSVAAYLMALGAKEIAIVLPYLVFSHSVLYRTGSVRNRLRSGMRAVLPFAVSTLCYLIWRLYVLGSLGGYRDPSPISLPKMLTYFANVIQAYVRDLVYPVDFLQVLNEDAAYNLTPLVILYAAGYIAAYGWIAKNQGARHKRLSIFLGIWLFVPLALFLVTVTFSHRSMYLPTVAFCALAALPQVESFRWLSRALKRRKSGCGVKLEIGHRLVPALHVTVLVLGSILVCSLTVFSPVLQSYDHWTDSAKISYLFLKRLCEQIETLPDNSSIHIYNLPDRIQSYLEMIPHAKEVTYLRHYSIKSWLNMQLPGNRMTVIICSRSWPHSFSGDLDVSIRSVGAQQVWALVKVD